MNNFNGNGNMPFNPQTMQQIRNMKAMLQGSPNPMAVFQSLAQMNPQINQVLQMCQGQNPKDLVYAQCKQMGINPDEFINMLKQ